MGHDVHELLHLPVEHLELAVFFGQVLVYDRVFDRDPRQLRDGDEQGEVTLREGLVDLHLGLGQVDDLLVVFLGCRLFLRLCPKEVVQEHVQAIAEGR